MNRGYSNIKQLLAPLIFAAAMPTYGAVETARYALLVASNDGGAGRVPLKFAETDALAVGKVFEEIGGVMAKRKMVVLSPTRRKLMENFADLRAKMAAEHGAVRKEFIFYYSGHSDDKGLLFKDGIVEYKELREVLHDIQADVRVAILDSCQSGAFTRLKGGERKPPFLVDESNRVKGNVFIAASSASEAAQESDHVNGSFFTHYLVSALRGAGDLSADNKVTINEAYQYAYQETLARTETTRAGAQHPEYDIQIAGAGDLVLTDLRVSNATLLIDKELEGRLFIRDQQGRLVVELNKTATQAVTVSLEAGAYTALLDNAGQISSARFNLDSTRTAPLTIAKFLPITKEKSVSRGDEKSETPSMFALFADYVLRAPRGQYENTVSAGFVSRKMWYGWTMGADSNGQFTSYFSEPDYFGKGVSLSRQLTPIVGATVSYYHANAVGAVDGLGLNVLFNLVSASYSKNSGIHLIAGIGAFMERFQLPKDFSSANPVAATLTRERFHVTGSVPIMAQIQIHRLAITVGLEGRIERNTYSQIDDFEFVELGWRF